MRGTEDRLYSRRVRDGLVAATVHAEQRDDTALGLTGANGQATGGVASRVWRGDTSDRFPRYCRAQRTARIHEPAQRSPHGGDSEVAAGLVYLHALQRPSNQSRVMKALTARKGR